MRAQDSQILASYINKKRKKSGDDCDNNVIIYLVQKNMYVPIPTCNSTCKQMAFGLYEKKKIRMKMWVILWCNQVFIALATVLFLYFYFSFFIYITVERARQPLGPSYSERKSDNKYVLHTNLFIYIDIRSFGHSVFFNFFFRHVHRILFRLILTHVLKSGSHRMISSSYRIIGNKQLFQGWIFFF